MASGRGILFWSTIVFLTLTASAQGTLPYIPTTILPLSDSWACENHTNRGLYIFSPTDTSVDLLFINTSSTIKASSVKPKTLTTGLPFVNTQSRTSAFAPSIADDGTLTVFAGDCSVPGSEAIWIYGQMASTSSGPGWVKHAAPQSSTTTTTTPGAPYLLGGSMSFSSTTAPDISPPVTYIYGGMCPWANTTTSTTWQSAATYSNRMLKVSQHQSREGTIYTTETTTTSAAGPPRAEAGFTFTALTPALSNRSGTVSQEISHVLLGGHTQGAFINMSTAAVWNLPEETWNIVYINPPPTTDESSHGGGNTELLAVKATTVAGSVESRSGHTAVLNEDGTALVVFGGWVGDLSRAASPQLVILEMGGSLAEWRWSIPELQPSGPGIYGHGAVLLPGNVMMVYGGYATASTTAKRATTQQQMFLNLTSLTWSDEYSNPSPPSSTTVIPGSSTSTAPSTSSSNSSTTSSSTPSKLGLGLGLGLGISLLALLIAAILFLRRRRRLNRLRRDEIVRDLSQDARRFLSADDDPDGEMTESDAFSAAWFPAAASWNATAAQDWYTGGGDAYQRGSRSLGYETLRGRNGMAGVPMPPSAAMAGGGQGNGMLGRSRSAARGLYLPSTAVGNGGGYEFGNVVAGKGGIHPTIYEAEDEDGEVAAAAAAATAQRSTSVSPEHPSEGGESDPFVTPASTPRGHGPIGGGVYFPAPHSNRSSATPSPEHPHRGSRTYQAQDAEVQEWVSDIDAADAVLTARIGPHGGTTTTVGPSGMQVTPPKQTGRPGGKSRRNSFIEGGTEEARTGSNLSESARSTFSFARGDSVRIAARGEGGTADSGGVKRTGSSSGSSSHTYNTAKTHSNNNFANLREEGPSLLLGSASRGYSPEHNNDDDSSPPGSPSKHKPRRSWLGSLRRVFSGSITESSSSRGESPTHGEGGGSGSDYEPRLVGMGPGGRLLRRKQGREAWAAGEEEEEDEWDVERAVEQRLVQIMFTVPKERLRVVNAEVEEEETVGEIVDPERERLYGDDDYDGEFGDGGGRYRRGEVVGSSRDEEKMALRRREEEEEEEGYTEKMPLRMESDIADEQHYIGEDEEKMALSREDRESRRSESTVQETRLEVPSPEQERRPSTPMTPTTFHTAEMVKMERPPKPKVLQTIDSIESLERPKTKVLQMVESIESLSREGSPATSPARKK
ncbi:hypothetical protein GE09DRAFT_1051926 [Coniochaeta sp. 2T2.1]|nr:hypothetical protein GE09DRAFT_1051926 [Coniochaeta sp. 2T2.1]